MHLQTEICFGERSVPVFWISGCSSIQIVFVTVKYAAKHFQDKFNQII